MTASGSSPADPEALRALAAAVLGQAVADAFVPPIRQPSPSQRRRERDRADALDFLLTERCEPWCAACGIDPEAMRERLRARMRDDVAA